MSSCAVRVQRPWRQSDGPAASHPQNNGGPKPWTSRLASCLARGAFDLCVNRIGCCNCVCDCHCSPLVSVPSARITPPRHSATLCCCPACAAAPLAVDRSAAASMLASDSQTLPLSSVSLCSVSRTIAVVIAAPFCVCRGAIPALLDELAGARIPCLQARQRVRSAQSLSWLFGSSGSCRFLSKGPRFSGRSPVQPARGQFLTRRRQLADRRPSSQTSVGLDPTASGDHPGRRVAQRLSRRPRPTPRNIRASPGLSD
jgi:hypothetical protein